jgi:uncharacterized protein
MKITMRPNVKIKKNPIIIEGFPGFGLVGTIATEFLIEHLKTKMVGEFEYDELPATTAIHNGQVVRPMAIHYSEKHNILIFHTILSVRGFEWKAAAEVLKIAEQFKAKEIISLEGVNALVATEGAPIFSFGSEKLEAIGCQAMKESIIVGVTAALLLKNDNVSCLFAQTNSGLPDSKAAAAIIGVLDKYLDLKVDAAPLMKQAEEFEGKLKGILQQTQQTTSEAEKKNLSYLG